MKYSEQLRAPQWKAKRQEILKRDGFKCVICSTPKPLHVHHTKYISGRMAWEVPNDLLVTLCSDCHAHEHKGKDIKTFVRKPKKQKAAPAKRVSINRKRHQKISGADQAIQARYDNLKRRPR